MFPGTVQQQREARKRKGDVVAPSEPTSPATSAPFNVTQWLAKRMKLNSAAGGVTSATAAADGRVVAATTAEIPESLRNIPELPPSLLPPSSETSGGHFRPAVWGL